MKEKLIKRTLNLHEANEESFRQQVLDYFHSTYDLYELLFEGLVDEKAFYIKADRLRHPLIFYFGHTAVFFINKLNSAKLIKKRLNREFESMFAVGVDEMSWDDLDEKNYNWPSVDDVRTYRNQVRACVADLIEVLPLETPIDWQSSFWPIIMGIEHERIHLETSSVLIRQLPLSLVKPHDLWSPCLELNGFSGDNSLAEVEGGVVTMGKSQNDPLYGWDNEYGKSQHCITAFKASKHLVCNMEFLPFVEDGGYENDNYWESEGLQWRQFTGAKFPHFWLKVGEDFRLRCMLEEIEMPWSWPVEVNYHEAKAFCNWKSAKTGKKIRLPLEEEWFLLRERSNCGEQNEWDDAPGNINLEHYTSPCPVNKFRNGDFFDVIGNVWQWTESPIFGFDGFKTHVIYDDFSTPTFDGRHNLIKGGAWISTGNEATKHARYAFRRHFFQYAGFRYIESEKDVELKVNTYETDALIAQYCEFHYGAEFFGVPSFHKSLADLARQYVPQTRRSKALDLGCAVGRLSFELAQSFDAVIGLDFSANFIKAAIALESEGVLKYSFPEEGDLVSFHEVTKVGLGFDNLQSQPSFYQADACNLPVKYRGYDVVIAANLIDRLYSPRKFLTDISDRINPGGILIISSPYTWLEEFTPKEEWLGGYKRDGETVTSLEGLKAVLNQDFEMLAEPLKLPFVIRETRNKFQHSFSEASVWRRR